MAFTGYYGFVGAGKTLSCVVDIYKQFKRDPEIVVLTNTPLSFPKHKGKALQQHLWNYPEELQEFFLFAFTNEDLVTKRKTIVLIDEANLVLPSRLFAKLPPFFLSFFAQARKMNIHVYFTTQHFLRIDVVLRELVEVWVRCEPVGLGWIRQTEQEISPSGTIQDEFDRRFIFFKKKYYSMYDTLYKVSMDKNLLPPPPEIQRMKSFLTTTFLGDVDEVPLPSASPSPEGKETGEDGGLEPETTSFLQV